MATTVEDSMSFGEAFQAARAELGSNGVFTYQGNQYSTMLKEELDILSPEEKEAVEIAMQETMEMTDIVADEETSSAETTTENTETLVTDTPTIEPSVEETAFATPIQDCLLYTSPSPRD